MKRIYYLTGNLDSTEQISTDLHQTGITDWHFHVLSKDEAGLYKRHIHSANYLQQLDIVRSGIMGALIAFGIAIIVVAVLMITEPFGPNVNNLFYLIFIVVTTMFGAWDGGLIGVSKENKKLAEFHDDLEAGKYLVLVDVRREEEGKVTELMKAKHPEAQLVGTDTMSINPFKRVRALPH